MEHRWCKRWGHVVNLQMIDQCGTECVASTRNISMDGMFVVIPQESLNAARLVYFQLPAAVCISRLEALVVHTCEHGAGMMFCAIENRDRHLLARYLSEVSSQRGE